MAKKRKKSATKRISAALSRYLKKMNPAKMKGVTHVRVRKLQGGGVTILPFTRMVRAKTQKGPQVTALRDAGGVRISFMITAESIRWNSPLASMRPYRRKRGAPWGNRNAARFTPIRKQTAQLVTFGMRARDIAALLNISVRTAEDRIYDLMRYLGVHSRLEVALRCWRVAA